MAEPQPNADAALAVAGSGVLPEQVRQALRCNPPALVRDRDRDMHVVACRRDTDWRGLRGVPSRVGEQVVQHLHDAPPVGHHAGQVRRQVDEHRVPGVAGEERGPRLLDQLAQRRGLGRDRERAGVEPPRIQQVADQRAHAVGLLVDDAEELPRLRRTEALRGIQHRRRRTLDGGERRAQLVAHHPQEIGPHPVERLERRQVLRGGHQRPNRTVLGVDRGRVEQHAHAAPARGRDHHLFGAQRLGTFHRLAQREAVELDLAPVGEAAGRDLEHVLARVVGDAQYLEHAPRLAVEQRRMAGSCIEYHDADRRGLDQGLDVGAGALLGPVGAGVDDGGCRLRREQQQHLLVLVSELGLALLVAEEEVADMGAEMAQRRAHAGARQHDVPGHAQRTHEGGEVGDPKRPRQVAKLLEEPQAIGPLRHPAVVLRGQARGDEVPGRSRLVDGDDAAVARAGELARAVGHFLQDGFEVEAGADAQQRLAQGGQA